MCTVLCQSCQNYFTLCKGKKPSSLFTLPIAKVLFLTSLSKVIIPLLHDWCPVGAPLLPVICCEQLLSRCLRHGELDFNDRLVRHLTSFLITQIRLNLFNFLSTTRLGLIIILPCWRTLIFLKLHLQTCPKYCNNCILVVSFLVSFSWRNSSFQYLTTWLSLIQLLFLWCFSIVLVTSHWIDIT